MKTRLTTFGHQSLHSCRCMPPEASEAGEGRQAKGQGTERLNAAASQLLHRQTYSLRSLACVFVELFRPVPDRVEANVQLLKHQKARSTMHSPF